MELIGRLELIAKKVPNCQIVCDIGTDHAYIPIHLVEKNACKKAIASDVKIGPVRVAAENIKKAGLETEIDTRMGYGLKEIKFEEVEVVVVAGMGGILIKDILSADFEKAKKAKTLILQPMNAIEILREWLCENNFYIYDEELVSEGDKIYVVIAAKWTGETLEYEEIDFYIGRKLVERKDPLLCKYINKMVKQLKVIIKEIEAAGTGNLDIKNKYINLKDGLCRILEILKQE